MCGIFGVFNFTNNKPINTKLFKEATSLISHRGPDGEGFFFDHDSGVGFGHRRLSIIDLSTGDQPMCNEDKTIWIIFNGEIYNYLELRKYLISKGHIFKTKSDTEVLIHAYEEFGEDFPNKLNGIFAFAIWNAKRREIFLARDHFGVKPLYFLIDNEKIVFASEIKSILHYSKTEREINLRTLNLCLTFRHTPSPYTLIKGIEKLPPTHYLVINDSKKVINPYWNRNINIDHSKSEDDWIRILKEKLHSSVKRQMMSDVPIGISLSGGLDSGALFAIMSKFKENEMHAFTVGFEGGKLKDNEISRAKDTALKYGVKFHSRIITSKDYSKFLEKYLWHLEEPLGNESAVAVYFIADMATGIVKVLLNGQGADEIFGGYNRHKIAHYFEKYHSIIPILKSVPQFLIPADKKNKFQILLNYINQKNEIEKLTSAYSIIPDQEKKLIFSEKLFHSVSKKNYLEEVQKILDHETEGNIVEKMFLIDMFTSLSENLLLVQDKLGMAAGIETRVPYLDIEYASLALCIPSRYKINWFKNKYIHKKVCESIVSKDIVHQRKIGFQDPVEIWLKESLGEQLMDIILSSDSITANYLKKSKVEKMFNEHKNGQYDHKRFLYLLLSIEKWAKIFLKSDSFSNFTVN